MVRINGKIGIAGVILTIFGAGLFLFGGLVGGFVMIVGNLLFAFDQSETPVFGD